MNIKCEPIKSKPEFRVMRPCSMCGDYFDKRELNSERLCKRCAEYRELLTAYHREMS